jgi:hypothetical protein
VDDAVASINDIGGKTENIALDSSEVGYAQNGSGLEVTI